MRCFTSCLATSHMSSNSVCAAFLTSSICRIQMSVVIIIKQLNTFTVRASRVLPHQPGMVHFLTLDRNSCTLLTSAGGEQACTSLHTHSSLLHGFGFLCVSQRSLQLHQFTGSPEQHFLAGTY